MFYCLWKFWRACEIEKFWRAREIEFAAPPEKPSLFDWHVIETWEEFQDEVLRGDSKTSVHDRLVLLEKEDGWVRYGPGCMRTWSPKRGWLVLENQPGAAEKWLG